MERTCTAAEVARHNTRESCWVIVAGQVYDVTAFLDLHPGGAGAILKYAGKDSTEEYELLHPPGTIEKTLAKDKHKGSVEQGELDTSTAKIPQNALPSKSKGIMPISVCQNLDDFEAAAQQTISRRAWVYFHSGADSLHSIKKNRLDWEKITFRPRILRNVARVRLSRSIMGVSSNLPFFIAPAALARLAHPDGELCLARGAARKNIPYCMSTYSSVPFEDIAACSRENGRGDNLIFQLYVPVDKPKAKELLTRARSLGYRAIVLTVDTAVVGRREEDDRYKAEIEHESGTAVPRTSAPVPGGDAPILRGAHSSTLDWADLSWIREAWKEAPLIIKGIQTAEDARLACTAGADGIILSNHGGRQLDFAPSSIQTLLEIRRFCPDILGRMSVYLDGGVRRGTDVIKALCLGATAVGLGRPFMYALGAYGTEGVEKVIEILSDEIETSLRLMGVTDLSQLNEHYVNTTRLERELPRAINDKEVPPRSSRSHL